MRSSLFLLTFLAISISLLAQERVITGTITGEKNNPIPGASVLAKGGRVGAVSNENGKYSINIPPEIDTLEFLFPGLEKKDVSIGILLNIDVQLIKPDRPKDKDVLTALAIERSVASIGYTTEEISDDEIRQSGEQNVLEALNAKAPSVEAIGSAGTPGASSRIIIRGNSSFVNNNQPLVVVDGIPIDNMTAATSGADYPFNINLQGVNNSNRALDINPDDIESVNVLMGPASTTLYGVRGGAGAILITTKHGNVNDHKIHVTYSSGFEFDQVNKLPPLQDTYAQGEGGGTVLTDINGNWLYGGNGKPLMGAGTFIESDPGPDGIYGTGDDVSSGTPYSWGPRIDSLGKGTFASALARKPYDHYSELFKLGTGFNNAISIAGGNDRSSVRFSISNLRQNGVIPNTELNRTSARLNADMKVTDRLTLVASLNYVNTTGEMAQNGSNVSGVMLGIAEAPASYDLVGNSDSTIHDLYKYAGGRQRQYYVGFDNAFWSAYNNTFTSQVNCFIGNVFVTYKFTNWFDVGYRLGSDFYNDQRKQVYAVGSQQPIQGPTGQIEENEKRSTELYGDLFLNFHHKLVKNLTGSLTLGNNFDRRDYQDLYARGRNLFIPDFYNLSNAATPYNSEEHSTIKTAALFFDLDLNYKNMLYLQVTGRNEWSSTFGERKDNYYYPGANLSWVFSELIPNNKWITFAKVRLAFAQAGINPSPYGTSTYFTSSQLTDKYTAGISFPYLGQAGYGYSSQSILGNPDLKPEKNTGYEAGIDMRFFNNRLTIGVTYYYQKTTDAIVMRPVASSSGFSAYLDNSGAMSNKGIEITAGADIVKLKNSFVWNVSANFSRNQNEVLQLAPGMSQMSIENTFTDIGAFAVVGQPYGELYGSKWERTASGQLIINPTTGLPIVSAAQGALGNPYPDWQAGLRNTFRFKGVSVSLLFDIKHGGKAWCGTVAHLNTIGMSAASANREQTYLINGVVQSGSNPDGSPIYSSNTKQVSAFDYFNTYLGDGIGSATENAVFDASWVRLREITVSYHYDIKKTKRNVFIKSFEISFTGKNLWLHTKYPGIDPETSLTGAGSNTIGLDYFNAPNIKSYIVGFKASF